MARTPPVAGETYRYAVTATDIERGIPGDSRNCPVARAVQRRHGLDPEEIQVGGNVYYRPGGGDVYYRPGGGEVSPFARLGARVGVFVDTFDRMRTVKPIRFTLTWEVIS